MANPLNFLQTTNYPQSFLEGTFGNKFYQNVVEPAKLGTGPKPTLGQVAKNWNPLKAFTPQMLATGPTKAASTFLKSSGIGTLAGLLFDATPANAAEVGMTAKDFQNLALQNQSKGPLYVDPNLSYEDFPLTEFEKDLRYEPRGKREKIYEDMKENLEGMTEEEKKDYLHYNQEPAMMANPYITQAMEYTGDPVFEDYYETGEHWSPGILGQVSSLDDEEPYDFSGIAGQTAMLGIPQGLKLSAMLKGYLKNRMKYGAASTAANLALEAKAKAAEEKAAEEKAAADRKAQQQATIAANREAAKKFGDKPQPIYHQETKSQDRGGRDIGSRVSDSYEKQQSAQYGMLAKGGLVNFFKYGGFLG